MKKHAAFLFILPGLLGLAVFFILPFLIALWYAFLDKPVNGSFVGFQNFINLFRNGPYLTGLWNTLKFIGLGAPANMALALAAALLINMHGKYKAFFVLVFLIPLVVPSGSMVFFWRAMFGDNGFLNKTLLGWGFIGEKIKWLQTGYAQWVIHIIFIWKNLGYNIVLFLSGLSAIPKEHYEAAHVDGAKHWGAFRHITLPCLAPTLILALIMSIINSFKVFKEVYLLMGPYPHESVYTLQHFMNNMFYSLDYQKLAAATAVLVLAATALTRGLFRLERKVS